MVQAGGQVSERAGGWVDGREGREGREGRDGREGRKERLLRDYHNNGVTNERDGSEGGKEEGRKGHTNAMEMIA